MPRGTISIIIPAFNEEKYITATLNRVIHSDTAGFRREIIAVNDASTDATPALIKKFIKGHPHHRIILVNLRRNRGKTGALQAGILRSRGRYVIIQDADLEYDPADYPQIISTFLLHRADVVYGSRLLSSRPHRVFYYHHFLINSLLSAFSNLLTNLNLSDIESGCKSFRGDLIRKLAPRLKSCRFGFEPEITARISHIPGLRIFEIGISYNGRTYAEGKKISWVDGILAVFQILRFNLFP